MREHQVAQAPARKFAPTGNYWLMDSRYGCREVGIRAAMAQIVLEAGDVPFRIEQFVDEGATVVRFRLVDDRGGASTYISDARKCRIVYDDYMADEWHALRGEPRRMGSSAGSHLKDVTTAVRSEFGRRKP